MLLHTCTAHTNSLANTHTHAHIKCYAAWHEKCAKQTQHREDFDEAAIFNVFLQKMVCIYAQLGMMQAIFGFPLRIFNKKI